MSIRLAGLLLELGFSLTYNFLKHLHDGKKNTLYHSCQNKRDCLCRNLFILELSECQCLQCVLSSSTVNLRPSNVRLGLHPNTQRPRLFMTTMGSIHVLYTTGHHFQLKEYSVVLTTSFYGVKRKIQTIKAYFQNFS